MTVYKILDAQYSDAALVEGMSQHNHKAERALHFHCKKYFDENYRSVFLVGDDDKQDIFQEAFITLWQNILKKKIYVEDGELRGKEGKAFTGKLTTYFMSIAKLKYLEWVRKTTFVPYTTDEITTLTDLYKDLLFDDSLDEDEVKFRIIEECISHMSERCSQILTKFYYEMKTLDQIMEELTTFISKDALKTAKYKCMQTLHESANSIYNRYFGVA